MIKDLSQSQKDRFPEFVDKWLRIGLCTNRVNMDTAKWVSNYYYNKIAHKSNVPVVVMSSPLAAWLAVCLWSQVRSQVESQVVSQVWSQVWSQVESQVRSQVLSQVWSQVRSQVWSQVESQVESQVRSQVESQVRSKVWSQVESQVWSFIYPFLNGHFMAYSFSYYDYMNEVLDIKFKVQDKYDWYQKTTELGFIYPLENVCIISDRPEVIQMVNGRLHADGTPAIRYTDGLSIYALNGVRMKPEYVLTSAGEIAPQIVMAEQNVDQRRELIRKVGINRLSSCGKVIAEMDYRCGVKGKPGFWKGVYKLIDMSPIFVGVNYAPHLLMSNPSIDDTYHLEGVSPGCKTVQEAINWRSNNIKIDWQPYMLS